MTSISREDATFYGHQVTTQQILHGQVANKSPVDKLTAALPT